MDAAEAVRRVTVAAASADEREQLDAAVHMANWAAMSGNIIATERDVMSCVMCAITSRGVM